MGIQKVLWHIYAFSVLGFSLGAAVFSFKITQLGQFTFDKIGPILCMCILYVPSESNVNAMLSKVILDV